MQLNDIDDLIKKELKESEIRQELHLLQAKPRIWDAIEKPKAKKRLPWLMITSLAATLSLFLIAAVLLLKLESTENELEALKAEVKTNLSIPEKEIRITSDSQKTEKSREPITTLERAATADKHTNIEYTPVKAANKIEPIELSKPAPETHLEADNIEPEIDLSKLLVQEVESLPSEEKGDEAILYPTKVKQRKLKLKIGNGNPGSPNHQNTLAFNIKL